MAKSYWLINSQRTEVKRFIKNDKSIDGVFEFMFIDTGKIVREIYKRLLAQGWKKTKEVWKKKE